MKTIEIEEQQQIELNILKHVDRFCEENDLTYWACGGTLLGAVRHQGFIPWDDDIDIFMPRADFEKFCETYVHDTGLYRVRYYPKEKKWPYPYAKVEDTRTNLIELVTNQKTTMGIYIDIFPVDIFPDNYENAKSLLLKNKKIAEKNWELQMWRGGKSIKHFIKRCWLLTKKIFLGHDYYIKKITTNYKPCKEKESKYSGYSLGGYGVREIMPSSVFANSLKIPFEDMHIKAFEGYDTYLTSLYGDYMQLPPKEKQVKAHDTIVEWKEL